MSRRKKILATLLAVAAAATVTLLLSRRGAEPKPAATPPAATTIESVDLPTEEQATATERAESTAERSKVEPPDAGKEAEQGLRGRVTGLDGTPLADVQLVLFESYHRSPFDAHFDQQRGVLRPPIARTSSDSLGRFSIGLQRVTPDGYELLASHPDFADQMVPGLTLFSGRWTEIADIRLDVGVRLEGRVSVQGANGLPVADATVTVEPSGLGSTLRLAARRDRARSANTDSGGYYLIEHCPVGQVDVSAVAPNFARARREAVHLDRELANRVDFELPKGFILSGTVVDEAGQAIGGAAVEAFELSSRSSHSIAARSDADGNFELIGLVDTVYQLRAHATGYVREERKPVRPGPLEQALVLHRQGAVEISVRAPDGRPVTRFDAEVNASEEGSAQLHNVASARIHRVVPDALIDGSYTIDALDPGSYVVQVRTRNWAKTFSERFTIERGGPILKLEIALLEGGLIEGEVVDHRGDPLAGVSVETLDGNAATGPLARLFENLIAERSTRTQTYSGVDGRFELPHLAPGSYRLRLSHPEHAESLHGVIEVLDRQVHPVGALRLQRGAVITGTAVLDGAPAGQIQVTISSLPDPNHPDRSGFNAEATTDDTGRFRVSPRLPPGTYQARAARQTLDSPLLKVVDFTNTRQDFQIARGQETLRLHFSLSSN